MALFPQPLVNVVMWLAVIERFHCRFCLAVNRTRLQTFKMPNLYLVKLDMKTARVKTNSKYQKEIDRSFAVIYHNLKRIGEGKLGCNSRDTKLRNPTSLQQHRYRDERFIEKAASTKPKARKVRFSSHTGQIN